MKILVACEESQAVCKAFRAKGHEAYSCDVIECSGGHPEWHILGDCLPLIDGTIEFQTQDRSYHSINGPWDILIAHPPCTYLTTAANRSFSLKCTQPEKVANRWCDRAKAAVFFMRFVASSAKRIAIENPNGFMNTAYRKPDQIIHPYYFASSENDSENYFKKRTCLWLFGLKPLERTTNIPPPKPMYICQGEKSKGKPIGWCEGMRNIRGGANRTCKGQEQDIPWHSGGDG